jgi:flagellin
MSECKILINERDKGISRNDFKEEKIMRIQHNISALNTSKALTKAQNAQSSSLAKLSSGYSINKAADNAAGLAISEKMRSQIRGMEQASANATDATNLIQTAEGYMSTTNDILQRMRELAVQAANGTYDTGTTGQKATSDTVTGDRQKINEEIQQLTDELDRIAATANFNGMKLSNTKFSFQVGANTYTKYTSNATYTSTGVTPINWTAGVSSTTSTGFNYSTSVKAGAKMDTKNAEVIEVAIGGFDSKSLGVNAADPQTVKNLNSISDSTVTSGQGIDLTTQAGATASINTINAAISRVTAERARLGAVQNRLDYTIDNLSTSIENTTSSESAIRDTDMVSEMTEYTKNNVLSQAATAMMAQANTSTQTVLQLLQ